MTNVLLIASMSVAGGLALAILAIIFGMMTDKL